MKFRLSSLLLFVLTCAIAAGWYCDRKNLTSVIHELNLECTTMFTSQAEVIDLANDPWPIARTGRPPGWILYDATDPADRERYRQGKPSKLVTVAE